MARIHTIICGALMCLLPAATSMAAPPIAGQTFKDCDDCPEMVVIPGGSFEMGTPDGAPDERPLHRVSLHKPFALGKYEVTWIQWQACERAKGCPPLRRRFGGQFPAVNVSWDDANQYTHWLSGKTGKHYRLPTEAEWEYAAHAGSSEAHYWKDDQSQACTHANVLNPSVKHENGWYGTCFPCEDGYGETAPVGRFRPNAFGLYDMLGNVWEWTADCYADNYEGASRIGATHDNKNCSSRVIRGGSWVSTPTLVKTTARAKDHPYGYDENLGFRLARSLP